jgi:hypothetical protein
VTSGDVHRKYRVESADSSRKVLDGQRQHEGWRVTDEMPDRPELHDAEPVRVDSDHDVRARAEHAPAVIAVAAADVEHTSVRERTDLAAEPVPFQIGALFAVDMDAVKATEALASRMQFLQRLV